jgi:5-methyltetrahydrofolate--homocysteine methyltransferase
LTRPSIIDLARQRVVVLDGAMGSNLQTRPLDLKRDWLGHENASEVLNLSRPDVIQEIHEAFLEVGCDAVETNTFNGSRNDLDEADLSARCEEVNSIAAQIARRACDKFETPDRPRYVVGSVGPTRKLISVGFTNWDALFESFTPQMRGLIAGGVDVILIETQQDLLAIKCAINAANRAMHELGRRVPLMVQASFDTNAGQQMLAGSDASALVASLEPYDEVNVLGVNCAFGPYELAETVRTICSAWPRLVSALPNAGLPVMDEKGRASFPMRPHDFTKGVMRLIEEFGVNIVGGCCGTMPEHLRELVKAIGTRPPKARTIICKPQVASLANAVEIRQDNSYLIVAERTNTNGSRQFKRLLQAEDFDGLVSMARDEIREGSHVLDVCVDFVGRDGVRDMAEVVRRYVNSIKAPLMLDSTNPAVMEAGLRLSGGRCILNSMNLEDGEERVAHICQLARKYGAAVVAGTIDEDKQQAMARTRERKLSIATRLRDLAVKYGLKDEDILFDPLVLPISTGIEEDRRNAMETIEGTRLISRDLPRCHTVVGLSNVSFGLKPAARVVLNSVFLHELREAGLTAAIVHASKILPRNKIGDDKWNAALDLIYDRRKEGFDPLTHFIGLFPDGTEVVAAKVEENLPIEEVLKRHIIDGEKRDLTVHLEDALKKYSPLQVINEILLEGMKVVGELFGSGQMQLPFVLQSAETMKASVAYLEPKMERTEGSSKGKIVLATVKGDVHDIGKNLVDIILTNNGYTVFNLGIKQPVSEILSACRQHKADAVGMSGLLVKSVAVMKENLEEMNAQDVKVPVLLGGAALTRDYAEETLAELYKGPLLYCRDAFEGLASMDAICGGHAEQAVQTQRARSAKRKQLKEKSQKQYGDIIAGTSAESEPILHDNPIPTPPFWGRRAVTNWPARLLFPYINRTALFTAQWGFRQKGQSKEEYARLLEEKAEPVFRDLQRRAVEDGLLQPKIVYGYFPVQSEGDNLIVYRPEDKREWLRFSFPRQSGRRQLCISDFFRSVKSGQFDVLGVQLVTVGDRATEVAETLRRDNRYQDYLFLHGFGVESAEALAELWHKQMRQELGFASEDATDIEKLFHQGYRGSRYSFGYPACPNLEDRAKIAELLRPDEIGVALNENYMLVPEQSTDAIVVHHPQAKYFDV